MVVIIGSVVLKLGKVWLVEGVEYGTKNHKRITVKGSKTEEQGNNKTTAKHK